MHDYAVPTTNDKKEKGSDKVKSVSIEILDDNTYTYDVHTADMKCHKYSASNFDELISGLKEDFSPTRSKSDGKKPLLRDELMKKA